MNNDSKLNGIESLRERQSSAGETLRRHEGQIDELFNKFNGLGRWNWQIALALVGTLALLFTTVGSLTIAPQTEDIRELKKSNAQLTEKMEGMLIRQSAGLNRIEQNERTIDVFRNLIRREENRDVISRPEYAKDWITNSRDQAALQKQLEELGKKIDAVSPARDAFADLRDRLRALEAAAKGTVK